MSSLNHLIESIATTISDYRYDEISVDEEHVERWIRQFPKASRVTILTEMDRIISKAYVSRQDAVDFLTGVIQSRKVFGENPQVSIGQTEFLSIQRHGNSQTELLQLLKPLVQNEYGVNIEQPPDRPQRYIYLDDALYTGATAYYDLERWIESARQDTELHLVFFAVYRNGYDFYIGKKLKKITEDRGIKVQTWRIFEFGNNRYRPTNFECLWPEKTEENPILDAYIEGINSRVQRQIPPLYRDFPIANELLFSSGDARKIVESEFLKAGSIILGECRNPKPTMRPVGYEKLESLGFGSMFFTFRNVANNTPLCLWWGDPNLEEGHPLSIWYPLFPRKVNEE